MQPHHQNNYTSVSEVTVLTNATLASSYGTLRDDGDYTKTWIIFM